VGALLLSPDRGLLLHMPVLGLSLTGLWLWLRRRPRDPLAWLSLGGIALFLAANASFNGWDGGSAVCARYQIPALPFWALAWRGVPWRGAWRKAFLGLAAASAFSMLTVAAVSPIWPGGPEPAGSVYGWTYRHFAQGKLAADGYREFYVLRMNGRRRWQPTNLGLLLGLPGLWSLLPLGAAFRCAWRRRPAATAVS
jgi:hypothetical protein